MPLDQPEASTQSIGDTTIDYLSYGEPHGRQTIMMLHATGFMAWLWHPIASRLADRFHVLVPDLFRHRRGDPHNGGISWHQLAIDIKKLYDRLGLETVHLVGHSMGAVVGLLAHTTQAVPVGKMVLIEPIIPPPALYGLDIPVAVHPLAAKAIKRRNGWPDREAVRDFLLSKPFFQSWNEQMLDLYIDHGTEDDGNNALRLACPPETEAALFMGGQIYDPWPELPKVACPTLVLEGAVSENRGIIDLKKITSLIPQGRYAEVAGAGHLIPMEMPEETYRIIFGFLDER